MGQAQPPAHSRLAAAEAASAFARNWRQSAPYRHAMALFAHCDEKTSAEAVADRATSLLADAGWANDLIAPMIDALALDPWFDPPLRFSRDSLRTGAILIDHPAVTITAAVLSAATLATAPRPATVVVPGRLSVVRYERGGGATLNLWRAEPAGADFSAAGAPPCRPAGAVRLVDRLVRRIDGRTHAQLIEHATSDVVTLTATIRTDSAAVMREYARSDGALVRVAALDDAASRTQMLAALLRHAGRIDAAEAFDQASRDPAHFVRWAVMREWLALDAATALPRLRAMLHDPHAEVRDAAAQMVPLVEARLQCRE